MKRYVIYTNPITRNMTVSEPEGPPLQKFKKGEEAEAQDACDQLNLRATRYTRDTDAPAKVVRDTRNATP